jgi:hypothetical protein
MGSGTHMDGMWKRTNRLEYIEAFPLGRSSVGV